MKDVINEIYNGFLLRDLLGYVLPGSFVLACLVHYVSVISSLTFIDLVSKVPNSVFSYMFAICLSYACGHFISGFFFHLPGVKRIFKYSPKQMLVDYPDISSDQAWVEHRSLYRSKADDISSSIEGHIERHAALLHFTGHFSAGLIFVIFYNFYLVYYLSDWKVLYYSVPFVIMFPGIFNHYKRLKLERYMLERRVITS